MKKFLALFIAATLLLSTLLITPVFAEGEQQSYAKDTVIQATVIMPETDAFEGIEGKLTYEKNTLEYCADSFSAPHVPSMIFNDKTAGSFSFNISNIDQAYDISEDHIIITAQFKVLADDTVPDITSSIDDAYYVESGPTFVDVSKKSEVLITVVSTPATDDTQDTSETQVTEDTQDTTASQGTEDTKETIATQVTEETQGTTATQVTEETQGTTATQVTEETQGTTATQV
ncbi:MAG: hypothetical protein IJT79_04695, partial [Ruminococcus sp.]|nr:hypothetical protein [Ruminococcus sp.]